MFYNTTFNEMIKFLPRDQFRKLVIEHKSDAKSRVFNSWDHLVSMLMLQFTGSQSLRDLELLSATYSNCSYHLNSCQLKRSTFSDANQRRSSDLFRDLAMEMLSLLSGKKEELKHLITLLDSSPISLHHGRGHCWANKTQAAGCSRGLKLHIQYDLTHEYIEHAAITPTNVNDLTYAKSLPIEENRIYVFDKGYCDYNWWNAIGEIGSSFVTRLKKNAAYETIEERSLEASEDGFVIKDRVIKLINRCPGGKRRNQLHGKPLRLIRVKHPSKKGEYLEIVSNCLYHKASVVAGWYKQRWSIELLFKWIKQNFKIKRFIGESQNAISIQIYTAIIAHVLIKLYQKAADYGHLRLKDILIIIRTNLFQRPRLFAEHRRRRKSKSLYEPQQARLI